MKRRPHVCTIIARVFCALLVTGCGSEVRAVVDDAGGAGGADGSVGAGSPGAGAGPGQGASDYQLVETRQLAGEAQIAGITTDGSCLWVAYVTLLGGYYDNNEVRVVCHDLSTHETLVEHDYADEYVPPLGLTWGMGELWLNYGTSAPSGTPKIKAIDPTAGAVVRTFVTETGMHDLAFDGQHVLLNNIWRRLVVMDPDTGGNVREFDTGFDGGTSRGMAHREGEVWVVGWQDDQIAIFEEDGTLTAAADIDLLDGLPDDSLFMAFIGEQLAVVRDSKIHFFDVRPITD